LAEKSTLQKHFTTSLNTEREV